MADSLETKRGKIRTTLHGRRLGLGQNEELVGVIGVSKVVTDATSATTGTNIPNHGLVNLSHTGGTDKAYVIDAPSPGIELKIVRTAIGTSSCGFTLASGTFVHAGGADGDSMTMTSKTISHVHLVGLSTSQYGVLSKTTDVSFTS